MPEPTHGIIEVKECCLLRKAGHHSDVALECNIQDLIYLEEKEREEMKQVVGNTTSRFVSGL